MKSPKKGNFDGARSVAEMLNVMDSTSREKLLKNLLKQDPRVVEKIKREMFTFEDLIKLSARDFQSFLKEVSKTKLLLAMRKCSDEFTELVFSSMSERAATVLKEELESQRPQKLSDVIAAQEELATLALQMIQKGRITPV